MSNKPLTLDVEWTFPLIEDYYYEIARIAKDKFGVEVGTNQIEIITAEQMISAYTSHAMPLYYEHWTMGLQYIYQMNEYKSGKSGLAYEVVINSKPVIAYLMEDNTMAQQILVMAHASFGHHWVNKNNYLFKEWTNPDEIIRFLGYSKEYIAKQEEIHGIDEVEDIIDACHCLMTYVDRYKKPPKLSRKKQKEHDTQRLIDDELSYNSIWDTIPSNPTTQEESDFKFPKHPEENILKFIEQHAPNIPQWKREIIKIVRTLGQYFYPQMFTQVLNEGFACVEGDTLIDTPNGLIRAKNIVTKKYDDKVFDGNNDKQVVNWFINPNKSRIKITTRKGFALHGGADHKIKINDEWKQLSELNVGDNIEIITGNDKWSETYNNITFIPEEHRSTIQELCEDNNISATTWWRWKNNIKVNTKNHKICSSISKYILENNDKITNKLYKKRKEINLPTILTEDFAYWLGLMIGDGNIHYGKSPFICLTTGDIELRDTFCEITKSLFGVSPTLRLDENRWRCIIYSSSLVYYLVNSLNMKHGFCADKKEIPEILLTSPKTVVCEFIKGHMDTDGCANGRNGVILVSKSKKLLSVEQELLLKMGIISSVRPQKDGCYRLYIGGKHISVFSQYIGFGLTRKQNIIDNNILTHKVINRKYIDTIETIESDFGTTYDFSVEDTHQYKSSCFINHNCFMHYHLILELYEEDLIDEGFVIELLDLHSSVIAQKDLHGINPYKLGFKLLMDIKRISIEPTDEDKDWFRGQDWVGNGEWMENVKYAVANFKDESIILQYLSPKLMRDFGMFTLLDDSRDPQLEVTDIHNEEGYKHIRETLSNMYRLNFMQPDIKVTNVDVWGDRRLTLTHYRSGRHLDEEHALESTKAVQLLWGYDVELVTEEKSYTINGNEKPIVETHNI